MTAEGNAEGRKQRPIIEFLHLPAASGESHI